MRTITLLFFLIVITASAFANVDYIDMSRISNDNKLVTGFNFIKANKEYYDHWTNEWNYTNQSRTW